MKEFAEKLKMLREEKGITQNELAEATGLSRSAISFWELSKRVPAFDAVITLAKFFNVSLEYLAGMED